MEHDSRPSIYPGREGHSSDIIATVARSNDKNIVSQIITQTRWTIDDICECLEITRAEINSIEDGSRHLASEQTMRLAQYLALMP